MDISIYLTEIDFESICLKRLDSEDPYTGRDIVLPLYGGGRITFKDAKPQRIQHLSRVLQEQFDRQFVKNDEGKWRNR